MEQVIIFEANRVSYLWVVTVIEKKNEICFWPKVVHVLMNVLEVSVHALILDRYYSTNSIISINKLIDDQLI